MVTAVIGAGRIGRTVAHAIAEAEPVVLVDSEPAALAAARDHIRGTQSGRILRGMSTVDAAEVLDRITFTPDLAEIATADFVIENITEHLPAKLFLHKQIDTTVRPGAVVAVNTSVIPITTFEDRYADPGRLVGVHFMNPATEIRTVEVVPSRSTRPTTLEVVRERLSGWGFTGVEIRRDSPGFVINRVLMQVVNEAADLVETGVADAGTVDALFRSCLGHRTGPLATADLIGLPTVADSLTTLAELTADPRYRPVPGLLRLIAEGRTGRAAGAGFFDYGSDR
jgi:3-hydroxyacyl-CoA dehydrogenase